jgi:rubredoxin
VLSPAGEARLRRYWPTSPKSIVPPVKLSAFAFAWFLQKTVRAGRSGFYDGATVLLLIWLFVCRHFYRRVCDESIVVRRKFRAARFKIRNWILSDRRDVKQCPVCGGPGQFEYENKLSPLFRCRQCDHVYAGKLPDDRTLKFLYGDLGYWERDRFHQGITTIQEGSEWKVYLNARMGILEKLKSLESRAKAVFEIGCAEGMLLYALGKKGIAASGCEMNRAVAQEGMRHLGVQILTDPFENLELPQSHFDLVMSFHTLEHMRFPAEIFAKAATILRPDGAILIEVPCGEEEYENTDHLHFFCENSLRILLNKFFVTTEILDNSYTNSAGVRIGSIYGFGRGVR